MTIATATLDSPEQVVQRQLDAYNAKDMAAWLDCYAPDAEQWMLHGDLLVKGHAAMQARMTARFSEPDLHATLITRTVMDHIVVDHESITRNFAEGKGKVTMLCIYEIHHGLIQQATFALGQPVLD